MSKYTALLGVLDQIRDEAPANAKLYRPKAKDTELVNAARSRAYIHLYLKVKFGLLTFLEREKNITDGTDDGGVDGFYIDRDHHVVYFIQSKFRTTNKNFEEKQIALGELLSMEVKRIVDGKKTYADGKSFSGKILAMQKQIGSIRDIGRYDYRVVLLANLDKADVPQHKLKKLVDGYQCDVIDHATAYNDLLFPVVAGTYYNAPNLHIQINLTNAAAGSARVRYFVTTHFGKCEITLLFVPTSEIGRILYKYRNSILRYNPRSYLGLEGNSVNTEIRATVEELKTNEFALFNNGITLLGDSAQFNESTGQEGVAQVIVTNPQIINGGQTAYTLSQLYEDVQSGEVKSDVFEGKEVLIKIISTNSDGSTSADLGKLKGLIEQVSRATNSQTRIDDADRRSNDRIQLDLQREFFDRYGLYYERKLGEFYDGLKAEYIDSSLVIPRNTLVRVSLACDRRAAQARSGIGKYFSEETFSKGLLKLENIAQYVYGLRCLWKLDEFEGRGRSRYKVLTYGQALRYGRLAVVSVCVNSTKATDDPKLVENNVHTVLKKWPKFERYARTRKQNAEYFGAEDGEANYPSYYKGRTLDVDLGKFFKL